LENEVIHGAELIRGHFISPDFLIKCWWIESNVNREVANYGEDRAME